MAESLWFSTAYQNGSITGQIYIDDTTNKVTRAPYVNNTSQPCLFIVYYPDTTEIEYALNPYTIHEYLPIAGQEPSVEGCSVAFYPQPIPGP